MECKKIHYPRRFLCPSCGSQSFRAVPLEGECELLTWTRLHSLQSGFEESCLTFGIVRYPNGLRVTGRLEAESPRTGMKLNTRVGQIRAVEGDAGLGLIFTPKEGDFKPDA